MSCNGGTALTASSKTSSHKALLNLPSPATQKRIEKMKVE
jgi:hypothetical protein